MRRLVALTIALLALTSTAAGCRRDGREMRPALPSQDGTVSTTAPPTVPVTEDDFFSDETDASGVAATEAALGTAAATTTASTTTTVPGGLAVTAPWREGAAIDPRYTCKGDNLSPALSWAAAPPGTLEIAVTMVDLDFTSFQHWAMAGIGPGATSLAEGTTPPGAFPAANGSGAPGYAGPCPPAGTTHSYRITVHFLDQAYPAIEAPDVRAFIEAATFSTATVTGTFTGS